MKMEMGTYFIFFRKVYVIGKWLFYAFQWLSRVVSWKVFNSPFLGYNILDIFKVFSGNIVLSLVVVLLVVSQSNIYLVKSIMTMN